MENYLNSIKNTSIFLAKILYLNDKSFIFFPLIKAICCITKGINLLQSNCNLSFEVIEFSKSWMILLYYFKKIILNLIALNLYIIM